MARGGIFGQVGMVSSGIFVKINCKRISEKYFEGAELVLAAVYDSNANAGLPDVERYRFPLRAVTVRECIHEKLHLLSGSVLLGDALPATYWYSRGWTFRESRLASMHSYLLLIKRTCSAGAGRYL